MYEYSSCFLTILKDRDLKLNTFKKKLLKIRNYSTLWKKQGKNEI